MAEEERIYVGIIDPKGDACPVPYGTCNSLCDNCKGGMTRQEAINKMAKAICMQDNLLESCKHCITQCDKQKQKNMCEHILKKRKDNIEPSYFDKAEAALNALLGVKK